MNAFVALILISLAAPGGSSASAGSSSSDGTAAVAARPAWVDAQPGLRDGVYETQTILGPEATRDECEKKVLPAVRGAVEDYARRWSESNGRDSVEAVPQLTDDEITRRIIGEKWEEHVKVDGADRIFLHVKLRFDAQLQQQWRAAAQAKLTERRSIKLAALFLLAMWGLGVTHVALRVDSLLAVRTPGDAKPVRLTRVVLWGTAGLLSAIPLLVVA